jgi:hypothetical protein
MTEGSLYGLKEKWTNQVQLNGEGALLGAGSVASRKYWYQEGQYSDTVRRGRYRQEFRR